MHKKVDLPELYCLHSWIDCDCVCGYAKAYIWRSEDRHLEKFSPSTLWVLGIESRASSGVRVSFHLQLDTTWEGILQEWLSRSWMGGPNPLWAAPFPVQVVLDWAVSVGKWANSIPPWFLLWVPSLTSPSDGLWPLTWNKRFPPSLSYVWSECLITATERSSNTSFVCLFELSHRWLRLLPSFPGPGNWSLNLTLA